MNGYPRTFRFTDGTETTICDEGDHARRMIECRGRHEYVLMVFAGIGDIYGCWRCISAPLSPEVQHA